MYQCWWKGGGGGGGGGVNVYQCSEALCTVVNPLLWLSTFPKTCMFPDGEVSHSTHLSVESVHIECTLYLQYNTWIVSCIGLDTRGGGGGSIRAGLIFNCSQVNYFN